MGILSDISEMGSNPPSLRCMWMCDAHVFLKENTVANASVRSRSYKSW